MFTQVDSVMWQIISPLFFLSLIVLGIILAIYVIILICIIIKRVIFGTNDNTQEDNKEDNKDSTIGFALENKNIRRE